MNTTSLLASTFAVAGLLGCVIDQPESSDTAGTSFEDHEIVGGFPAAAHQVIVRYDDASTADPYNIAIALTAGAVQVRGVGGPGDGLYLIEAEERSVAELVEELSAQPGVLYAEPNYQVRTMATPNDPSFGQLWGLNNTGQTIGGQAGTADADIDAAEAWDLSTGSASNVVGVVDTGIAYNHPDLEDNVWSASSSFTVNIGGQSITCPVGSHGFNAIFRSCDPLDDHGHGSHCAGTIGAKGNNGEGVAGVNWTASIMGLKFLAGNGAGTIEAAIDAIEFAIQVKQQGRANVRVLSNSWGGVGFSQALLDVINKANANGILFVAAAGNANSNNDTTPVQPGGMTAPNLISVAATDNRDARASFSNFGPTTVHLGAPGVEVLSTHRNVIQFCNPTCLPEHDYVFFSGTSMATPHVAGAAALILASCSGLDTAGLKSTIVNNVDPISALATNTITGGRLNVNRAIRACAGPFHVTASPSLRSIARSNTTSFAVTVGKTGGFAGTVSLSASGLPSGTTASFSPPSVPGGSGSSTLTVTTGATTPLGTYTVTITGTSGTTTRTTTVTLDVANPDFPMSVSPATQLVNPGKSAPYAVSLDSRGGFASAVNLSISGLPSGATASFSPSSLTPPGSSTLTVNVGSATPEGVFTLTISGAGGGLTRTRTVTLEVRRPTFSFRASTPVTVPRRFPASFSLFVTSQFSFSGSVSFSVSGLCSGCTWTNPTPVTISPSLPTGYRLAQVRTSITTPPGAYTVTFTATGGGVTKTFPVTLNITP